MESNNIVIRMYLLYTGDKWLRIIPDGHTASLQQGWGSLLPREDFSG